MTVDDLPLEIRERICFFVDVAYPPSVYDFALVSKQCLEAATASLFKTIRISFAEPDQLNSILKRCHGVLQQRNAFKHVRRLEIVVMNGSKPRICSQNIGHDLITSNVPEGSGPPCLSVYSSARALKFVAALEALTSLVTHVHGLTSVRYICAAPIPQSLLQELLGRPEITLEIDVAMPPYPRCCFVESDSPNRNQVIAQNASMLSSPRLRQIGLYPLHNCANSTLLHSSMFLRNLDVLAPEVDALAILFSPPWIENNPAPEGTFLHSPDPVDRPEPASKRKVKDLRLMSSSFHEESEVRIWDQLLELSCIETLHISVNNLEFERDWFTSARPFKALRDLHLDHQSTRRTADKTAVAFLDSLSALRRLSLTGLGHEHLLRAASQRHGKSLREIRLKALFNDETLNNSAMASLDVIRQGYQNLVALSISVQRISGDEEGILIYHAIGCCVSLQDVDITLMVDSEATAPIDESSDSEAEVENHFRGTPREGDDLHFLSQPWRGPGGAYGLKNGDVHNHLVDCAVDARLAQSIFHRISTAKPSGAKPLSCLRIRVGGAGELGQSEWIQSVALVTQHLARSWLVIPHPNVDRPGELLSTEMDPPEDVSYSIVNDQYAHKLPKALAPIFRRIWPEDPAVGDWRREWHSLPLDR